MRAKPRSIQTPEQEGLPPFVKSWPQMYGLILGVLVAMIVFFYAFMIHFQ
ncbi:hypothetical protein [Arundinibacter roseus]|nr:hypothetical protein [Arundinibacter roseus]